MAVLGASSYTFAEATWTQTLPDWTAEVVPDGRTTRHSVTSGRRGSAVPTVALPFRNGLERDLWRPHSRPIGMSTPSARTRPKPA